MAEETQPAKWEGKATVELASAKADQIWPCFEDYCNLQKWFPGVETCHQYEGELGQPGLVRYCTFTKPLFPTGEEDDETVTWGKEKLLMIDPFQHCLSYEMLDNTFGLNSYVATIKVSPIISGDGGEENGCKIEWSFVAGPIEGRTVEEFASLIDGCLKYMAKKMEDAALADQTVSA